MQWLGIFEGEGFGFRFAPSVPGIQINDVPTGDGRLVRVQLATRYLQMGSADPFPVAFRANVLGDADSIQDVIDRFWQAVVILLPPVSVAANANFTDLNPLAAIEISNHPENEMLHRVWPPQALVMRQMKILPEGQHLLNTINATLSPSDSAWLHRATLQYSTALDYWRPGQELFAVQHLFMAAEVLSRVVVERQLTLTKFNRDRLARAWGVKRSELEFYVRATAIFRSQSLASKTEDISNGLEHGYETVPQLQRDAAQVRDEVCQRVRSAILHAIALTPATRDILLDTPYAMPARTDRAGSAVVGKVLGDTSSLEGGVQVPFLSADLDEFAFHERLGGGYAMSMTHKGAVTNLPEGLQFRVERVAYSGPIESAGEATFE